MVETSGVLESLAREVLKSAAPLLVHEFVLWYDVVLEQSPPVVLQGSHLQMHVHFSLLCPEVLLGHE
eukprot:9526920-Prorocentrum_lima.AAC.1